MQTLYVPATPKIEGSAKMKYKKTYTFIQSNEKHELAKIITN